MSELVKVNPEVSISLLPFFCVQQRVFPSVQGKEPTEDEILGQSLSRSFQKEKGLMGAERVPRKEWSWDSWHILVSSWTGKVPCIQAMVSLDPPL